VRRHGQQGTLRSHGVTSVPVACTVRGCGQPLARERRRVVCPSGHAYDIARSGYLNLLQPQDRRSREAGDARDVVQARAAVIAAGVGRALFARVAEIGAACLPADGVVVDLGSGTGDALGALAGLVRIAGIGIDLSPAAAELAARRFPDLCWVVANADRKLPLLDRSVDLALSLHGRRNPVECARVLRSGGRLIAAVPAADDLMEIRAALHGRADERSRTTGVLAEFEPLFSLEDRQTVRDRLQLSPEQLRALLRITYRGARTSVAAHVATLPSLHVTIASELFIFKANPEAIS
jgi:23S rRNA (guanine745-N1)-methyltransferase